MKLKNLLKGCMNTVDSVRFIGISKGEAPRCTYHKAFMPLSDAEMSAEVCKWSVKHVEDDGNEADDTKIELTVYVKYGTGES